jgi:hypothetical protein
MAGAPDGKMLYVVAAGDLWAVPMGGAAPVRMRAAASVAIDPAGRYLVLQSGGEPNRYYRVPLDGGSEQEIPLNGELKPAYMLHAGAVARDGRILTPLGASNWYWPAGILDPATGLSKRIATDPILDYHALGWTPDGKVIGLGLGQQGTLWRYRPEPQ